MEPATIFHLEMKEIVKRVNDANFSYKPEVIDRVITKLRKAYPDYEFVLTSQLKIRWARKYDRRDGRTYQCADR